MNLLKIFALITTLLAVTLAIDLPIRDQPQCMILLQAEDVHQTIFSKSK